MSKDVSRLQLPPSESRIHSEGALQNRPQTPVRTGVPRRTFKIRFPRFQTQIRNKLSQESGAGKPASRRVSGGARPCFEERRPAFQVRGPGSVREGPWPRAHDRPSAANSNPGLPRLSPISSPHSAPLHSATHSLRGDGAAPGADRESGGALVWTGSARALLFPGASVGPICTQGRRPDLSSGTRAESDALSRAPGSRRPTSRAPEGGPPPPGPPPQLLTYLNCSASARGATSPSRPPVDKPVSATRQSEGADLRPRPPGLLSPDAEPPLSEQLPATAGKGWCSAPSSGQEKPHSRTKLLQWFN
ncbi:basic salivary proline-rich protein 3-like isoform X2 [Mesocricetus auratus]|uniref:Basic salivary proline-rich protein 3-like isoform X2 n=1 Tax=Mesocricetus auratus TaxID=10036 RepID=A0ABM2XNX3_MESAU|nr:basic salivary proline-rich protein 3-like isoform X2 [Mesocricetus auratus]